MIDAERQTAAEENLASGNSNNNVTYAPIENGGAKVGYGSGGMSLLWAA